MNYLDIFFLVLFLVGAFKGYSKGLIVEIFSFIAFFAGLFIAIEMTLPLAYRFFNESEFVQLISIGVFIVLFLVVVLLVNLAAKTLKKAVDLTIFGIMDNVLGALASVFKWAFIISVVIWIFDSIGLRLPENQTSGSLIYPYIKPLGPMIFEWMSAILPFIRDMLDSIEDISEKQKGVYTFLL